MGKAHEVANIPKCKARLNYCFIIGPLLWENAHMLGLKDSMKKRMPICVVSLGTTWLG